MEVDRISQIGRLGGNANPAWQKSAVRRRRFVEEIDADPEDAQPDAEGEDAAAEQPADGERLQQAGKESTDEPDRPEGSFRAIA